MLDALAAAIEGRPDTAADAVGSSPPVDPAPDVYLAAIHAEGFRGIGPHRHPPAQAGTGTDHRHRTQRLRKIQLRRSRRVRPYRRQHALVRPHHHLVKDGWRNLHARRAAIMVLGVATSSQGAPPFEHHSRAGEALTGAPASCNWPDLPPVHRRLGWCHPPGPYRPFLSYAELGGLLGGKPSEMHYSLHDILGLVAGSRREREPQRRP